MDDEDSVSQTINKIQEWDEFGRRLTVIFDEFKEKTGEAALYITEDGEYFVHPEVRRRLDEPGNEGPLEFLRFMQRNGMK